MRGEDGSDYQHSFNTREQFDLGYDGPLGIPTSSVSPRDFSDAHSYQQALLDQNARDDESAYRAAVSSRNGRRGRCRECYPPKTFADWGEPDVKCRHHAQERVQRFETERARYLTLPAVSDDLMVALLRGERPDIIDGKTHHFYDWTCHRVARAVDRVLGEPWTSLELQEHYQARAHLLPTGHIANVMHVAGYLGLIERESGKSGYWSVQANPEMRFNTVVTRLLSDPLFLNYEGINKLPEAIKDRADRRRAIEANRVAREAEMDERARQRASDARFDLFARLFWLGVVPLAVLCLIIYLAS